MEISTFFKYYLRPKTNTCPHPCLTLSILSISGISFYLSHNVKKVDLSLRDFEFLGGIGDPHFTTM